MRIRYCVQDTASGRSTPHLRTSWELALSVAKYTANGWRVFPVAPGQKTPAVSGWQTFDAGDPTNIDTWWGVNFYNVGVQTGRASGIIVLDIDPRHDGDESLRELENRFGKLPDTVRVLTANGGVHYYFSCPTGEVRNGARIYGLSGVDVRGDGGYVVAPPSALDSGGEYTWDAGSPAAPALVPGWIVDRGRAANPVAATGEPFPEGTRNDTLARIAGSLRRYGVSEETTLSTLMKINAEKCSPPLEQREVELIARSIRRYSPSYSPGRGEGGNRGNRPDERGSVHGPGLSENGALRREGPQRHLRSGAWYLGRGR